MHYFDTSFIAPLFFLEEKSNDVESVLNSIANDRAVSFWLHVEFSSTVSKYLRMKNLNKSQVDRIMKKFQELISGSFYTITPTATDYHVATSLLQRLPHVGLRSGDALHLAIAQSHGAKKFYTLDKILGEAAKRLTDLKVVTA